MKFVLDMNLSPDWVDVFVSHGWEVIHWSRIGNPRAPDAVIMAWARTNGYVVFTHDLDFGTLLALTHAEGPSVIQVRIQDVMPFFLGERVVEVLHQYGSWLEQGALLTIDESKERIRILPF